MPDFAILGSRGSPSTYGGYETLVRRLAPYIKEQGHAITVYGRGVPTRSTVDEIDGVRVVETRCLDRKSLSTVTAGFTSTLDARKRDFDAMLVLNCANGLWLPMLERRGIPTALNVDGIEWERGKWGRVARTVFWRGARATARHADVVVADSVEIGRVWGELFDVDATFIPYGADIIDELDTDKIDELGLTPGGYVLAVARLVPENNVELLLDALDLIDHDRDVGSANYDSPVVERLERFQAAHPNAQALGHVHDQELLDQLWHHAGVYYHGHSVGGTNPALLQALGAGSPTIALDNPFNREVIGADDQLMPAEPSAVGATITELLANPERRTELAERGRARIADQYTWPDICARYLDVLVKLAEARA